MFCSQIILKIVKFLVIRSMEEKETSQLKIICKELFAINTALVSWRLNFWPKDKEAEFSVRIYLI